MESEKLKKNLLTIIGLIIAALLLSSCEEEISLELPVVQEKLVIDGYIEPNGPALVWVSRSIPFSVASEMVVESDLLIRDALITITDGMVTDTLKQIPGGFIFGGTGLYWNYNLTGQIGQTYELRVEHEGRVATATTTIPQPIALDSIWFQTEPNFSDRGFIRGILTDPDTIGNYYKVFSKAINKDIIIFWKPFGTT